MKLLIRIEKIIIYIMKHKYYLFLYVTYILSIIRNELSGKAFI